jgi:hypothetical protein
MSQISTTFSHIPQHSPFSLCSKSSGHSLHMIFEQSSGSLTHNPHYEPSYSIIIPFGQISQTTSGTL